MLFPCETSREVPQWAGLLASNIPMGVEKMSEQEPALAGLTMAICLDLSSALGSL